MQLNEKYSGQFDRSPSKRISYFASRSTLHPSRFDEGQARSGEPGTEEDFETQGPLPPDGNPIILDGDFLGGTCIIYARNADILAAFRIGEDLGLDDNLQAPQVTRMVICIRENRNEHEN
ncbi:hypothetical protein ACFL1G_11590 [Planctomycetota bacterium]